MSINAVGSYLYIYPSFSYGGATTFASGWAPYAVNAVNAVNPRHEPNPYAVDPDARHLARIRRELAAPWPPKVRP